jgi:hypothetical protein
MWFVRAGVVVWKQPGCPMKIGDGRSPPALGQGAKPFVGHVRGTESEKLVRRWQDEGSQAAGLCRQEDELGTTKRQPGCQDPLAALLTNSES